MRNSRDGRPSPAPHPSPLAPGPWAQLTRPRPGEFQWPDPGASRSSICGPIQSAVRSAHSALGSHESHRPHFWSPPVLALGLIHILAAVLLSSSSSSLLLPLLLSPLFSSLGAHWPPR